MPDTVSHRLQTPTDPILTKYCLLSRYLGKYLEPKAVGDLVHQEYMYPERNCLLLEYLAARGLRGASNMTMHAYLVLMY